jgi:hypothetical protein
MIPTCSWCASDAYVDDYDEVNDLALCTGPGHGERRMFQPKAEHAAQKAHQNSLSYLSDGIAADLGLYDTLPDLLNPGEWADTPTVEYRLGIQEPDTYKVLLDRWGHVSQGPRKYSTTSFVGSTLGQLSRATNVTYKPGQGTGIFKGNSSIGFWTLEPVPAETTVMTWKRCAEDAGVDPNTWPFS